MTTSMTLELRAIAIIHQTTVITTFKLMQTLPGRFDLALLSTFYHA